MEYSFTCYGHENITSKHKTTLEFTKDKKLSLNGDCIVGVSSDFSLKDVKKFIKNKKKIKIIIEVNGLKEEINGFINPDFNDYEEIVIRKTDFISKRTLVINANKSSVDLPKEFVNLLKKRENKVKISFF